MLFQFFQQDWKRNIPGFKAVSMFPPIPPLNSSALGIKQ